MTDTTLTRPPFDPELEAALALVGDQMPSTLTPEMIPLMRQSPVTRPPTRSSSLLDERGFTRRDVTIAGHDGDEIVVSVIEKAGRTGTGPGFFHTHGGGMIIGDRWLGVAGFLDWAERFNGVIVTVEYRLAPEFPDPYPGRGLLRRSRLDGRARRTSSASTRPAPHRRSQRRRRPRGRHRPARPRPAAARRSPASCSSTRCSTTATRPSRRSRSTASACGTARSNVTGWTRAPRRPPGTDDVSIYAAPARATDLSGPAAGLHRLRQRRGVPRRGRRVRLAALGRRRSRPSCTCGPVASTASTCSRRTPRSRRPWSRPATTG